MSRKLLLIGGGGHCHSVIDSVRALGIYDELGIVDSVDAAFSGVPVIGQDEDIPRLMKEGWTEAVITVGSVGNTGIRRRLYEYAHTLGLKLPVIVDPTAVIAGDAKIGEGTFIGKRAVVNAGSNLGECAIINTGAIVEHDCVIGDFAHVSPGTVLCGMVKVGADSHVGAGSVVKQLVSIGSGAVIGAGSVVVKDVPDKAKAFGNPCRVAG